MRVMSIPEAAEIIGTTPQMLEHYSVVGVVNDKVCGLYRLLYHWSIFVDLDAAGYRRRYCYTERTVPALIAFTQWQDGEPEPKGWSKDVAARVCQDPETGERWGEDEYRRRPRALKDAA